MRDNPRSNNDVPSWAQMLISVLYWLCIVVGLLVGVYGLYVLVAHVIIIEELNLLGLILGVPLTAGGFGLFAFARNRLFGAWSREGRYKPRSWAIALLGLGALVALAYVAFVALRGI